MNESSFWFTLISRIDTAHKYEIRTNWIYWNNERRTGDDPGFSDSHPRSDTIKAADRDGRFPGYSNTVTALKFTRQT